MKLIVGLGNPGTEYTTTRHNIGFIMLNLFCEENGFGPRKKEKKFNADIIKTTYNQEQRNNSQEDIIFCKPQTYMNKSGESIKKIVDFYKIPIENILVLHDDIDLPTGKIQKKIGGSHAGHNGLKSILQHLPQNKDGENNIFTKIRIGIGRPANKEDVIEYVLQGFSTREREELIKNKDYIFQYIIEFLEKNG